MIRIEIDPYEKKDLITYLEYAKGRYMLEPKAPNWDNRYYNVKRIEHLIDVIEGRFQRPGIYTSSFETIEHEPTAKEKQQMRYKREYDRQQMKRRAKALKELEESKKKKQDIVKEFESIWKD